MARMHLHARRVRDAKRRPAEEEKRDVVAFAGIETRYG
jgi:hypothetical protein